MRYRLTLFILLAHLLVLTACKNAILEKPLETDDGWLTARPSGVELDDELLVEALEKIKSGELANVHSMLIVKDGKLVLEEYFDGYAWEYGDERFEGRWISFDRETKHTIMSVTKAFTSALIGIAIQEGYITDEHSRLFEYFPEYAQFIDKGREAITLEHLLTMTSGLEWNEADTPYSDTRNDLIQLFLVEDPVAYILSRPLIHEPGTHWNYSGGDVNLLGEVIHRSTGRRMDEFAAQYLMEPLGFSDYQWDFINPDFVHASGSLELRPRDMAKFGQLILNDGVWEGEQILPSGWIKKTETPYIGTPWPESGEEYGYQWWLKSYPLRGGETTALHRTGWGGQDIAVFDELDMVVVFTGGNYVDPSPNNEIMEQFILTAVEE